MADLILNRNDLSTLNKSLSALNDLTTIIDKLEAAGVDVTDHKATRDYYQMRLEAIKRQFFPTHP